MNSAEQASVSSGSTGRGPATISTSGKSKAQSESTSSTVGSTVSGATSQKQQLSSPRQPSLQHQQQQPSQLLPQQNNSGLGTLHMHPLAMSSSSDCPPHVAGPAAEAFLTPQPPTVPGTFLPFLYNPLFMQAPIPQTSVMAMFQQQQQKQQQPQQAKHHSQQQQQQQQKEVVVAHMPALQQQEQAKSGSHNIQGIGGGSQTPLPSTARPMPKKRSQPKKKKQQHKVSPIKPSQISPQQPPPPFLLFDASCELRTNLGRIWVLYVFFHQMITALYFPTLISSLSFQMR